MIIDLCILLIYKKNKKIYLFIINVIHLQPYQQNYEKIFYESVFEYVI